MSTVRTYTQATFASIAKRCADEGMELPVHLVAIDARGSCLFLIYVHAGVGGIEYSKVLFEHLPESRKVQRPINIMVTDSNGAAARFVIADESGEPVRVR